MEIEKRPKQQASNHVEVMIYRVLLAVNLMLILQWWNTSRVSRTLLNYWIWFLLLRQQQVRKWFMKRYSIRIFQLQRNDVNAYLL